MLWKLPVFVIILRSYTYTFIKGTYSLDTYRGVKLNWKKHLINRLDFDQSYSKYTLSLSFTYTCISNVKSYCMGSCMNMLSFIDVGLPVEFHSSVCQYLFFTGEIIGNWKKGIFICFLLCFHLLCTMNYKPCDLGTFITTIVWNY